MLVEKYLISYIEPMPVVHDVFLKSDNYMTGSSSSISINVGVEKFVTTVNTIVYKSDINGNPIEFDSKKEALDYLELNGYSIMHRNVTILPIIRNVDIIEYRRLAAKDVLNN